MDAGNNPLFTFIHLNDAYNIQANEKGQKGAVNFEAYVRKLRQKYPSALLIHSGDAFSPSDIGRLEDYNGKQMVYALNKCKVDLACIGNHEFDPEDEETEELFKTCEFPWILGNIMIKGTNKPIGGGLPFLVKQINGKKVGFFGLGGEDWLGILGPQFEDDGGLDYVEIGKFSNEMCKNLREKEGCEIVVAVTHMREVQDLQLPELCKDIDIILGGHDHVKLNTIINNIPLLKSGQDFEYATVVHVYQKGANANAGVKGNKFDFDIAQNQVPIAAPEDVDKELQEYVAKAWEECLKHDVVLGYTEVDLDIREHQMRTHETNDGNFLCDLARLYNNSDCCIMNSGSIRYDNIVEPKDVRLSVFNVNYNCQLVVKEVPGAVLLQILERSVSYYPAEAGSFLQVSGIQFTFDHTKTPRVQEVRVANQPLKLDKNYTVTCSDYVAEGGDGYDMLKECKYLIEKETAMDMLTLIQKFFRVYDVKINLKEKANFLKSKLEGIFQSKGLSFAVPEALMEGGKRMFNRGQRIRSLRTGVVMGDDGKKKAVIAPKLEGRIRCLVPDEAK